MSDVNTPTPRLIYFENGTASASDVLAYVCTYFLTHGRLFIVSALAKLAHFAALRAARRARVRAAFLREALRIKLLRARRRRAGRRVAGFVIMAQARLARRHAGRAVRSDTLLRTVKSIQCGAFPTRRAVAAHAAPSTPRLVSAARVGPVVYGLLLTFRGDGYG